MSSTRPNLCTLMLAALAVPIGLFALFTCLANSLQSNTYATLAAISGALLVTVSLPALVFLVTHLARRLRRRRAELEFGVEPPTCPACGYDLRASPDHCPECGHPVPPLDRTIIQYLIRLRRKG